jgi:hypothetical protein
VVAPAAAVQVAVLVLALVLVLVLLGPVVATGLVWWHCWRNRWRLRGPRAADQLDAAG